MDHGQAARDRAEIRSASVSLKGTDEDFNLLYSHPGAQPSSNPRTYLSYIRPV